MRFDGNYCDYPNNIPIAYENSRLIDLPYETRGNIVGRALVAV